jgi:hypothetical protein
MDSKSGGVSEGAAGRIVISALKKFPRPAGAPKVGTPKRQMKLPRPYEAVWQSCVKGSIFITIIICWFVYLYMLTLKA